MPRLISDVWHGLEEECSVVILICSLPGLLVNPKAFFYPRAPHTFSTLFYIESEYKLMEEVNQGLDPGTLQHWRSREETDLGE